jgi:hypothetical protein
LHAKKKERVGFEQLNDIFIAAAPLDKEAPKRAEVVGSNPTRSISFVPVNYGIELNSILTIVYKTLLGIACKNYLILELTRRNP